MSESVHVALTAMTHAEVVNDFDDQKRIHVATVYSTWGEANAEMEVLARMIGAGQRLYIIRSAVGFVLVMTSTRSSHEDTIHKLLAEYGIDPASPEARDRDWIWIDTLAKNAEDYEIRARTFAAELGRFVATSNAKES